MILEHSLQYDNIAEYTILECGNLILEKIGYMVME